MYLDTQAPPDRRAGTQGLWVMTTSGLGSLCGGLMAGEVMQRAEGNWPVIFAVPTAVAAVALVLVVIGFRSRSPREQPLHPLSSPRPATPVPLLRTGGTRIE